MSIHKGDEVWAGKCMEWEESGEFLKGSYNTANDEGTKIEWGYYLGPDLSDEEISAMLNKLRGELNERHYYTRLCRL